MSSLKDALKLLEEVEKIVSSTKPTAEDKRIINEIIAKNMKIEAEIYSMYLKM